MRIDNAVRTCAADTQGRRTCVNLDSDLIISSPLVRTTQAEIKSEARERSGNSDLLILTQEAILDMPGLNQNAFGYSHERRKSAHRLTATYHPGE